MRESHLVWRPAFKLWAAKPVGHTASILDAARFTADAARAAAAASAKYQVESLVVEEGSDRYFELAVIAARGSLPERFFRSVQADLEARRVLEDELAASKASIAMALTLGSRMATALMMLAETKDALPLEDTIQQFRTTYRSESQQLLDIVNGSKPAVALGEELRELRHLATAVEHALKTLSKDPGNEDEALRALATAETRLNIWKRLRGLPVSLLMPEDGKVRLPDLHVNGQAGLPSSKQ